MSSKASNTATDPARVLSETVPLGDLLVRSATNHPERIAIAFPDRRYTYAELLEGALETARGLYALGVRRGDHVGILMPNTIEYVDAYFGVALLGAVLVPLNARYRATELGYVIDHAQLKVLLSTDSVAGYIDFRTVLSESLPSLAEAAEGRPLELPEAQSLSNIVMMRGASSAGFLGEKEFRDVAATVDPAVVDLLRSRVSARDTAMVLYTSGTTAQPKGCLISQEGISRGSMSRMIENVPLGDVNTFWCPGPLFHIASMQVFVASIGLAGTFVTATHFDADEAWNQIVDNEVTSLWPWFQAVMLGLEKAEGFDATLLTHLQSFSLIGPPVFLRRIQALLPGAVHIDGCGMSELSGYYSMSPLTDDNEARATNGGCAVSGVEIRIVDPETGVDLPPNSLGEILVRGYLVMDGYYRDPERTRAAIDEDGWLHTGDLYVRDETGHITYTGRLKDMLKVGGENVPAIEVEAFLCTHPLIKMAEVVGRADERLDEVPVAFVEIVEGSQIAAEEIIEFCRGKIASFKVPRAVYFKTSSEWPMSATKINKVALREEIQRIAMVSA